MKDRYEIITLISKDPAGGMYLAEDTTLGRKVVFRHIDSDQIDDRPESWAKDFSTFAGKLCALQHPNLLTIYDVSVDEDGVSMVTQFIEGESLAERLEQGPLRQMGAYRMASDLLEALHAAHTTEVYHGALHTGSVKRLPRATGGHRYLIVDLGLNTLATMVKGEDVHIADPVLLAPELSDAESDAKPDVRADLFMLGQLCYTALAGGHPFAEKSPEECAQAHLAGELPPLTEFAPDIQADFVSWITQLCSGEIDQRPASIKEAMTSLHAITIDEPEPNVPGETHAVMATPVEPVVVAAAIPAPSPASQVVLAPDPVANFFKGEQKSKNKSMIIISSLCVLIVLGLWIGLTRDGKTTEQPSEDALSAIPDGVKVHLHDVQLVNTIEKRSDPVVVDLNTGKTLDWIVAIGAPAASNRAEKDNGNYVQSVFASGDFVEFAMQNVPVRFKSAKEKSIIPKAATDTKKKHKAELGDGWEVMLRIPKKHKDSVIINLYMTQWNCDFDVAVTMADGKDVIQLKVPKQDPGVVKIPLEIPKPKSGGFYNIKITAASSDPANGFTMGINAIHVESR